MFKAERKGKRCTSYNGTGLWACHATDGPPKIGPPGPSAAKYFAVDGPPGPSMAAMDGPTGPSMAAIDGPPRPSVAP